MGLLDHKRQWEYELEAAPAACVEAFRRAFSQRTARLVKAHWEVRTTSDGGVATYGGRGAAGDFLTAFSGRSSSERDGALGSEVTFEVVPSQSGRTQCRMWLSTSGSFLGLFTNDARFIRPHMQAVERHLRELDPSLLVAAA